MKLETYNIISTILQALIAMGALGFGWWQIKINKRLQELQDYVAISIVPAQPQPGTSTLQIINVGKINLYLQKYEIGTTIESFAKPMLIPAGANSFLLIPIKNFILSQKMSVKLYLIDEMAKKYLSTGEVLVEQTFTPRWVPATQIGAVQVTSPIQTETIETIQVSAWTYKTIKNNWEL